MVEKWLQSKPNPYANRRVAPRKVVMRKPFYSNQLSNPLAVQRRMPIRRAPTQFSKMTSARYGVPIQLFKDSDRDGVANVFDCRPFNKRKQDVMHPQNFGSGVGDMYARQEQARQQREYQKMLKEMQRQEEERIAELRRIQGETQYIDRTQTIYEPTPYVFNVAGDKLVPANSAEGKAGIAKLQQLNTSSSSSSTTSKVFSGPVRPSDNEQVFRTTGVSTGGKTTTTSSNALTKLLSPPSNALTKALSNQNKTYSPPKPAPAPAPRSTIAKIGSFISGKGYK